MTRCDRGLYPGRFKTTRKEFASRPRQSGELTLDYPQLVTPYLLVDYL